jgi:hypothetical protein
MEREVDRLIMVETIMDLTIRYDLLINYLFLKHIPTRKKCKNKVSLRMFLRVENQRIINECGLTFYKLCCQNCVLF